LISSEKANERTAHKLGSKETMRISTNSLETSERGDIKHLITLDLKISSLLHPDTSDAQTNKLNTIESFPVRLASSRTARRTLRSLKNLFKTPALNSASNNWVRSQFTHKCLSIKESMILDATRLVSTEALCNNNLSLYLLYEPHGN